MNRAVAAEVRSHLLKTQLDIATQSNGPTVMRPPKALEQHMLPMGTPIDIDIYRDFSGERLPPSDSVDDMIPRICDPLHRMQIGQLEHHLSLDRTNRYKSSHDTRSCYHRYARDIMWMLFSCMIRPQHNSKSQSVLVTWRLTEKGGRQPSFDNLDAFETELSEVTFAQPRLYEFSRKNANCGAWAVNIPPSARLWREDILNHVAALIGPLPWFDNVAKRRKSSIVAITMPCFGTIADTR